MAKMLAEFRSQEVGTAVNPGHPVSSLLPDGKMATRAGGHDRTSTKAKLARELVVLGEVIARVREEKGLRQATVAQRLGLPASWLSKVENGNRRLDVVELLQIARAMEVEPAELVAELDRRLSTTGPSALPMHEPEE